MVPPPDTAADYVLVVLEGDDATRNAAELAERLAQRMTPRSRLSQADVHACADGRGRTIVLFGHGLEGGLGPTAREVTCTANQLAELFSGSRVFAYACDTLNARDGHASLGQRVVDACVDVFVGFSGPIQAPSVGHLTADQRAAYEDAALAMIAAFIEGVEDEPGLTKVGIEATDRAMESSLRAFFSLGTALDQLHLRVAVARKRSG